MWEKQQEMGNAANDSAKTAPISTKRRWDQETPEEPFHKKMSNWQAIETEQKCNESSADNINTNIGIPAQAAEFDKPKEKSNMNAGSTQKKSGFSMGVKKSKPTPAPIKITLGSQKQKDAPVTIPKTKLSAAAASAFNDEDESEEEEMPPEAKMRMRNIGRDTPTAAGPNSFGKGRLGFCDRQRMIQKEIEKQIQKLQDS